MVGFFVGVAVWRVPRECRRRGFIGGGADRFQGIGRCI